MGTRSQLCPKVGFGISIVELLCLNSGEPANITRDFMFTECFTLRMRRITIVYSTVLLVLICVRQSLHNNLYTGLINGVKEEVINHGYGKS